MGQVLRLPSPALGGGDWCREQRRWWLLWASCPGVGWVRLREIEGRFGDLAAAWCAPLESFASVPGLGAKWLEGFAAFRERWGSDPFAGEVAGRPGPGGVLVDRGVLLPGDRAFPPALLDLDRPPLALYWRGAGSLWPLLGRRQAVAVVGTRRPSRHGLAMAESLGAALARAGWPVVSGLAEGIDAAVHRGCLAGGGWPVGVLGTPLERVYPRHHGLLQRQVGGRGLLVSEQPSGAAVRPGHFASRNRLQVALARALVVVECPEASGALHSARLAWRSQLPLWVVPADAARPSARGSNRLLTLGASALLEPDDLIRQLGAGPRPPMPVTAGEADRLQPSPRSPQATISSIPDAALLAVLQPAASLEQVCRCLDLPAPQVAARLLSLELAGLVRAEPGLRWRRL